MSVINKAETKILIAEDSPTQSLKLQILLEEQKYQVMAASNGKEALEMCQADPPNLIITDIEMPEMSGYEFCEAVKNDPELMHIPVILLTSLSDPVDVIRGVSARGDCYVTKPYNGYFLSSKIEHHLMTPIVGLDPDAIPSLDFTFKGKEYSVKSTPGQMLGLLLSIYEDSVLRNYELTQTEEALEEITQKLEKKVSAQEEAEKQLKELNDSLEAKVVERTVALEMEILEHKATTGKLRSNLKMLRKAMEGTITAMANTLDIRDPYTADHQRRVVKLAVAIGEEMDISKGKMDGLRMAGVIHDIGKIAIPLAILNKPGKITDTEFTLIKTHSEVGYDILKKVEFPWPIADIVIQHHERLDGSGYPKGLSGDEILLEAKILAVADVVEAMSSHRPYRPALGMDKALEEIITKKGTIFDPAVVDACVKVIKRKGFTFPEQ
ncbi:HDIG domain-containing protein [Desulfatibacillum alkenivorans DSM 16219]|jgi:putative nucleotidyltransferase with HDIG domain|uniref:HDIG domain-containing protein n=1 Tax=Desulfatibacillum alkenivorans DSM 16219 TaxID=1121393 RepID=A0A1M6R1K0_9BACT|nr:HD domain-containing phosphohydrolase [Desulfatibacillum alkenivorans]SHK26369.1 HDIG domain-containing protein [Desulfatibacillum alkenivorans DSM 16219]